MDLASEVKDLEYAPSENGMEVNLTWSIPENGTNEGELRYEKIKNNDYKNGVHKGAQLCEGGIYEK